MTANLVVQVSMEPKLVAVALERESVTARLVRAGAGVQPDRAGPCRPRRGAALRQAGGRRGAGCRRNGDVHERPRPSRRSAPGACPCWPPERPACSAASSGSTSWAATTSASARWPRWAANPRSRGPPHGGHPHALRRLGLVRGPSSAAPSAALSSRAAGLGRRSMRRVRMPSTSSASASPIMAKSVKSRWACSRKRTRSGPSIGGMPRVRTASARCWKRTTIS